MVCKKCGNDNTDDALFCSTCGKKIKENHKPKNIFVSFLTILMIFLLFVGIVAVLAFTMRNSDLNAFIQTFLEEPEQGKPLNTLFENTPTEQDETVNIITPPLTTENIIETGSPAGQSITSDKYYFINSQNNNIYSINIISGESKKEYDGLVQSFFVSQNMLYLYNDEGLFKLNTIDGNKIKIIQEQVSNIFISEQFIYYSQKNEGMYYTLYRTDLNGENKLLIKENIISHFIDGKSSDIFYQTLIDTQDHDERNNFVSYIKLPTDEENSDKYLTVFKCDNAGNSDVKIIEQPLKEQNIYFTNISTTNDDLVFILNKNGNKNLLVIPLNGVDYKTFEDINHLYTYKDLILFTKALADMPYVYEIKSYNSKLNEEKLVTEIFDYKSIHITENKIFALIDNEQILSFDFDGNDKKGFFDYSSIYNNLGAILKIDEQNIYLTNAFMSLDGDTVSYLNKTNGTSSTFTNIKAFDYFESAYWIDIYFKFLSNENIITTESVFGLADINNDGVCELFIGDKNNTIANNPNYVSIKSTKIYTIIENKVVEVETDEQFKNESSTYKFSNKNEFITMQETQDAINIRLHKMELGKIITEPKLKVEFADGVKHYKYENGEFVNITAEQYNKLYYELENEMYFIKKFDVNISQIVKGLYFNNYLKPEKYADYV